MAVPAGCSGRCSESRWPRRPPASSSLTAGAGLLGSGVPWFERLRSGEGFSLEATPPVDLCCTLEVKVGAVSQAALLVQDEHPAVCTLQPQHHPPRYQSPHSNCPTWAKA